MLCCYLWLSFWVFRANGVRESLWILASARLFVFAFKLFPLPCAGISYRLPVTPLCDEPLYAAFVDFVWCHSPWFDRAVSLYSLFLFFSSNSTVSTLDAYFHRCVVRKTIDPSVKRSRTSYFIFSFGDALFNPHATTTPKTLVAAAAIDYNEKFLFFWFA